VEPTAKLAGEYGVTEIETNVAVDLVVAEPEQAVMPRIKTTAKLNDRKAAMNFVGFLFILIILHPFYNVSRWNQVS
jgi:hypothetical protein